MQPARFAVADKSLEGGLVLQYSAACAEARGPERRARRLQRELVDQRLVLIDGAIDAVELLGGHDVRRDALLDLREPLVIGELERLEGAHELVERERHVLAERGRAGAVRAGAGAAAVNGQLVGVARGIAAPAHGFLFDLLSLVQFAHINPLLGGHRPHASSWPGLSRPSTS